MLRTFAFAVAFSMGTFAFAADDDGAEGLKSLEGSWAVVKLTENGEVKPIENFRGLTYVFEENRLVLRFAAKNAIKPLGKIVLDPSTKPRSIDIFGLVKTDTGIYELDGDTLKICTSKELADGPKKFLSTQENKATLVELKRVK